MKVVGALVVFGMVWYVAIAIVGMSRAPSQPYPKINLPKLPSQLVGGSQEDPRPELLK